MFKREGAETEKRLSDATTEETESLVKDGAEEQNHRAFELCSVYKGIYRLQLTSENGAHKGEVCRGAVERGVYSSSR